MFFTKCSGMKSILYQKTRFDNCRIKEAVGAQDDIPLIFISKTLDKSQQNYATNEKELYAIECALMSIRNYLYGTKNLEIQTDHQSLPFSVSPRNPNSQIKRWLFYWRNIHQLLFLNLENKSCSRRVITSTYKSTYRNQ